MQWLAAICVRRPIFATVLILVICVVGLFGYLQLGVDRFPKVDLPIVTVTTRLPGAAPEDVETEITEKIEEAVNTVSGIDELGSITTEGVSQVNITFILEKDADIAAQEVRDRLNTILPDLPKDIEQPTVQKLDPDVSPIVYLALNAPGHPIQEITEYADKRIRRLLETIDGVGQVQVVGGQERQVNVWIDPIALRGAGVTAIDVEKAISKQNLTTPGGRVDTGPEQLTLRIHGRVGRPEEIGELVVRQAAGHSIRVKDVARVEDGAEERETAAQLDGKRTVTLQVRKQSGSNTVKVADAIKTRIEELKKTLPAGYQLEPVRDDSGVIRTSVDAVREHLIVGAILAALVVLVFLGNLRSTIIAAIAIPTSIVGTFALMWIEQFTLNTITLLALALAVGIVIDDAIVVLENIWRHIDEKGKKPEQAALDGTKEIGLAVLATTLSLIAVFLPVAFMGGIPGRFLKSFGVTMAFAIAVSLLVSFTLTPMMASRWLKPKSERTHGAQEPLGERIVNVFYRPVERVYMAILGFVMRRRWIVVVMATLTLGSCFPLAGAANKGFLPRNDDAQFEVVVRAPEGTSLAQTELIGERMAREIRTYPTVSHTLVTVGGDAYKTQNAARIYVRMTDPAQRPDQKQEQVMNQLRNELVPKQPKDLRITISEIGAFSGGGFSTAKIQYTVRGPDLRKLEEVTSHVLPKLRKVHGAVDVDSSLILGKPELGVYINRARAADLGVQVTDIADALRLLVEGDEVSNYEEHGEQYDVRVRAEPQYRADATGLRLLTVPSKRLGFVPLSDVVDLKRGTGPAEIRHLNRQRVVTMLANVIPGVGEGTIAEALKKIIDEEKLPADYVAAPTGQTREMGRTLKNFLLAIGLSFVFMYLVLAAQFESWLHPFTILLSLPLTLPFAFLSIILFKQAIDIYSMLGILVLFGVVKKNSILQIDHTNQLRREGMPRLEAILAGNRDRLRPILMTTLAFVAGMIPLILSKGVGAGYNRATAGVVVGGQLLSLLLTLLATPVAYSLFDDASQKLRKLFRMKGPGEFDVVPGAERGQRKHASEGGVSHPHAESVIPTADGSSQSLPMPGE
ncbi:efflux RND transporter permease subunit [Pendulispora albinea]|uniref:Efflux RND transporter permease subunit n=1 Tax=Pendulispora albinea TaxID=2741071 RepID=A0ABZ2M879_9BACT